MSWSRWLHARQLLYEEFLGVLLRSKDNVKSAEYTESVARLKRQQKT